MGVNKVVYDNNTLIDISDTTATQANVLTGKYFYNSSGSKVAGTMANKTGTTTGWCGYETCTVQPHPLDASQGLVTVPNTYNVPGYYDKTSSITANLANLNASNIKKGVVVGRNGGNSSNSIVGTFSGFTATPKSGSWTAPSDTLINAKSFKIGFQPRMFLIFADGNTQTTSGSKYYMVESFSAITASNESEYRRLQFLWKSGTYAQCGRSTQGFSSNGNTVTGTATNVYYKSGVTYVWYCWGD